MDSHLRTKWRGKTLNILYESCIVVYLLHGNCFTLFSRLSFSFIQRHREIILSQTNEGGGKFCSQSKYLNPILALEVSTVLLFWQHIATLLMK